MMAIFEDEHSDENRVRKNGGKRISYLSLKILWETHFRFADLSKSFV